MLRTIACPSREVISTLFDRLYPVFQDLPRGPQGAGQVIVAAGDALMLFDAAAVRFDRPGIVALGAYATPEAASKHGVFCVAPDGRVRLFLQKPSLADQQRDGAIDARGQAVLDIAVMSFDAAAATAMFRAFDVQPDKSGPRFSAAMENLVLDKGLDLYREICCALGTEATAEHHRASSAASGSSWSARATCPRVCRLVPGAVLGAGPAPVRVPALRHHATTDYQRNGTARSTTASRRGRAPA